MLVYGRDTGAWRRKWLRLTLIQFQASCACACTRVCVCVLSPAPPVALQPLEEKPRRWQRQDAGVFFYLFHLVCAWAGLDNRKFQYGKPDEEDADAGKDMEWWVWETSCPMGEITAQKGLGAWEEKCGSEQRAVGYCCCFHLSSPVWDGNLKMPKPLSMEKMAIQMNVCLKSVS